MKKFIGLIWHLYQERKGRKTILSRVINGLVQEKRHFDFTVELLHVNHIPFSQNIQNGDRVININSPLAKAHLIWNDNGKNLIHYTINIF